MLPTAEGDSSSYTRSREQTRSASTAGSMICGIDAGLLVCLVLALFAILPLLTHAGLPNTADGVAHLMRQAELNQAWQDGILYPRWAPDLAYGYGAPLFHYAPPLLYQVTQLLHAGGLPLDEAMKGTLIVMMVLYSVGGYLLVRDLFGPRAGVLAAALYLYTPYRLREAYIQGNYGQFCGLAFYPLILWAFYRTATDRSLRGPLLAALSLAALLLSHNISFMLFAPLLAGYLVYLLAFGAPGMLERAVAARRFILAGALGLGLSAFFWLPAFGERGYIRLAGITTGFFDFRRNFISLDELLALPRPLDQAAINPYFPLSLGVPQVVLVSVVLLGLLACLLWRLAKNVTCRGGSGASAPTCHTDRHMLGHLLFFGAALLLYGFLMLPESQALWEFAPLLELAEFPWRMLGPAVLCAAVLAGGWVRWCEQLSVVSARSQRLGQLALAGGLALTLSFHLFYLFPAQFIVWGTPTPRDVMAYERQSKAIGTTSTGEFLPRWVDRYPSPEVLDEPQTGGERASRLELSALPPHATARTLQVTAHQILLHVSSPTSFTATFRVLYWPGWQVWIKRESDATWQPVSDVEITRPDGLIRAPMPAGTYDVALRLEDTPLRKISAWVSALALIVYAGVAGTVLLRRSGKGCTPVPRGDGTLRSIGQSYPVREALYASLLLLIALLVTRPLESWLRFASPPGTAMGVQYARRATFADQVQLLGYDLPSCTQWWSPLRCTTSPADGLPEIQAQAGQRLTAVLYWQAVRPLDRDYSVFLHLNGLDQHTYAGSDEIHPEDIPSSAWPATMYVRNPMSLMLPQDAPPVRYVLQAGLYDRETGKRLEVAECRCTEFTLAHVWLLPADPLTEEMIPERLDYRMGSTIQLLGYHLEETATLARLTLYWRAESRQTERYTVFIHMRDARNQMIAQADSPPMGGLYPTEAWLPGQIIADMHTFTLPTHAHTLAVGLYEPTRMQRLSVTDREGQPVPDDAVVIRVSYAKD